MYYSRSSNKELNKLKQSTAALSILTNSLLVILKLTVGIFSGAISIISEAAHSAVDLIASLIAYLSVRKSSMPPDDTHAYGHGKIENIAATIEALLIISVAFWIIYESFDKISSKTVPVFLEYGIVIMLISIGVNYWVSGKLSEVAALTGSHALEADALHLRTDIWTSVGVLIALVIIKITGFYWMDPLIAIIVALIILRAGYKMTKKNLYELTDISLSTEEEAIIYETIQAHPAVITFHQLRTRRSGNSKLIDMHIVLEKDMPLYEAHNVCDEIESKLKELLGECDITIHIEPCDGKRENYIPN